jgi:hypothetical protein
MRTIAACGPPSQPLDSPTAADIDAVSEGETARADAQGQLDDDQLARRDALLLRRRRMPARRTRMA